MAVNVKDSLAKILGNESPNHRHDIWLWLYLNEHGAGFGPNELNGAGMRDRMAALLSTNPEAKKLIDSEKNRLLLPDKYLQWITEDDRQLQWLNPRLQAAIGWPAFEPSPRLLGRERLVAMIDARNIDISQKIAILNSVEFSWNLQKKSDHAFRWFKDKNGPQRCAAAWEWLCKNKPFLTIGRAPIDSHKGLLAFFDQVQASEDEKASYISQIKKYGNQLQYRENMKGRQCNFVLSEKAISRLEKLAETHDINRTQVLEILIQMEADGGSHIADRLKVLRNL
jgi:hypothetical protein